MSNQQINYIYLIPIGTKSLDKFRCFIKCNRIKFGLKFCAEFS